MKKVWFIVLLCLCWLITAAFLFLPQLVAGQTSPTPTSVLKFDPPDKINLRLHVTGWDVAAWGLDAISGVLWGAREAYHADPRIFETQFGVKPDSFFGSQAWARNYNEGGGHKQNFGNTFRDVHHFAGTGSVIFYGTATVTICLQGGRAGNWKSKVAKAAIGFGIRAGAGALTYKALRS